MIDAMVYFSAHTLGRPATAAATGETQANGENQEEKRQGFHKQGLGLLPKIRLPKHAGFQ